MLTNLGRGRTLAPPPSGAAPLGKTRAHDRQQDGGGGGRAEAGQLVNHPPKQGEQGRANEPRQLTEENRVPRTTLFTINPRLFSHNLLVFRFLK